MHNIFSLFIAPSQISKLVRDGKHLGKSSIGERLNFGEALQKCFNEFVQQFLPHMEEEENIFQVKQLYINRKLCYLAQNSETSCIIKQHMIKFKAKNFK